MAAEDRNPFPDGSSQGGEDVRLGSIGAQMLPPKRSLPVFSLRRSEVDSPLVVAGWGQLLEQVLGLQTCVGARIRNMPQQGPPTPSPEPVGMMRFHCVVLSPSVALLTLRPRTVWEGLN